MEMMEVLAAILILLVSVSGLAVIWMIVAARFKARRSERLMGIANAIGMQFVDESDDYKAFGHFGLFVKGAWKQKLENKMTATIDKIKWDIFDYTFTLMKKGYPKTYSQTVIHAHVAPNIVPFSLARGSLTGRLAGLKGYGSVDFASHPGFSRTYTLLSPSEKIKELFNEGVLKFIAKHPLEAVVEAKNRDIIIYNEDALVSPARLASFFDSSKKLVEHLVSYAEIMKYVPARDKNPVYIEPAGDNLPDPEL